METCSTEVLNSDVISTKQSHIYLLGADISIL